MKDGRSGTARQAFTFLKPGDSGLKKRLKTGKRGIVSGSAAAETKTGSEPDADK